MNKQCLVAVYPSRNEAEQALRAALGSGILSDCVRISGDKPHVWDWLFSRHVPERDRAFYSTHLAEGRSAVSVLLDGGTSSAKIDAVEEILERYHPVDVHIAAEDGSMSVVSAKARGPGAEAVRGKDEEIIPLPREELKVGTRATDRVRYIRTYVVEEPVEQEVSLRDEQLIVERRPASTGAAGEISERNYEFHERHEEPIVEKMTRADEELVVRKEARQHTEKVRGTVRRTEVKQEQASVAPQRGTPPMTAPPKDRGGR